MMKRAYFLRLAPIMLCVVLGLVVLFVGRPAVAEDNGPLLETNEQVTTLTNDVELSQITVTMEQESEYDSELEEVNFTSDLEDGYFFDEVAHNSHQKTPTSISNFATSMATGSFFSNIDGSGSIIGNSYLEFYVGSDMGDSVNNGRFTIGNTGGNPNFSSDNNRILLFGHPNPWSSFTTIRINNVDYIFYSNNTTYDVANLRAVSTMAVDGVLITQTLEIVNNDATGYKDTVKISYSARNQSTTAKTIGIRIMMDTMLGDNDGAPFKVPSLGNVTYERELSGNAIPQSWQAFDNLTNPTVFAVGTLYRIGDMRPDKIQFAAWPGVYDSLNSWNYAIDTSTPITGDSAVAIYWNPKTVAAGAVITANTYYGVGYASSGSDSLIGDIISVPSNEFWIQVLDSSTRVAISGATVTVGGVNKVTDSKGIAKFTNPTETESTVSVSASGYYGGSFGKVVKKGTSTTILLNNSGEVNVSVMTVDGRNVLSATQTFTKPGGTNTVNISVDWAGRAPGSYQLMQNNVVKYTSTSSNFSLNIANTLLTGADVCLRLVSGSTVVKTIKTGIVVKAANAIQIDGDFTYASALTGYDEKYSYNYNDSWFLQNNNEYNHELSRMSLSLAMSAFQSKSTPTTNPARNVKNLFDQLGFTYSNSSIKYPTPTTDSIGFAIGSKTFAINDAEYTVIAVAIRGQGYGQEWASNFTVGPASEHAGFANAASEVVSAIKSYISTNGINKNIRIWITGYSRAGATANIAASRLNIAANANQIRGLSANSVFAYCFECPQTTSYIGGGTDKNIFNIVNPIDIVTKVAPSSPNWGFKRYGVSYYLPEITSDNSITRTKLTNSYYYIALRAGVTSPSTIVNDVTNQMSGQSKFTKDLVDNFASFTGGGFLINGGSAHYSYAYQDIFRNIGKTIGGSYTPGTVLSAIFAQIPSFFVFHPSYNVTLSPISPFAWSNYQKLGNAHLPELCLAWLHGLSGRSEFKSATERTLTVNCPVNVNVYDSEDTLVVSVVDHVVQEIPGSLIGAFVDENNQIIIALPADEEYRIEVIATDDGTVNYTINEYDDETGKCIRVINYYDIPVINGDILTGTAPNIESASLFSAFSTSSNDYQLTSGSALTITPSVDQIGEQVEQFDVTVNIDGNGSVYGDRNVLIGEFANFIAMPNDSDTFVGWYDETDNLLSTDAKYRFRVESNSMITAKFTGVITIPSIYDIWISDNKYDERQAATGSLDITLALLNAGTMDITSVDIVITGNNLGEVYRATLPCNLIAISFKELELSISIPELEASETYTLTINPTGIVNNSANNIIDFTLGEFDLAISSIEYLEQGIYLSDITVTNYGCKSDAILRINADDVDGAVLFEQNLGDMEMGENQSMTCDLDSLVAGMNITTLYATVFSSSQIENRLGDNIVRLDYTGNFVPSCRWPRWVAGDVHSRMAG